MKAFGKGLEVVTVDKVIFFLLIHNGVIFPYLFISGKLTIKNVIRRFYGSKSFTSIFFKNVTKQIQILNF